jgi:hypothetical protein
MRLLELPGLSVKVLAAGGVLLEEYEDVDAAMGTYAQATRYVEASAGANFVIQVHFTDDFIYPEDDIVCRILLDGHKVDGVVYEKTSLRRIHLIDGKRSYAGAGRWTLQKFAFAELQTSMRDTRAFFKLA